jgi:transposase-like protein
MLLGRVLENASIDSQEYSLWIGGLGPGKAWTKVSVKTFGLRNRVERFFGYIKQRTKRSHNNINSWRLKSMSMYMLLLVIGASP